MDIIEASCTCVFIDKFDAVNHALQTCAFSNYIHMYLMYGYEQFSGETCHLVYLELGINFQLLFQSETMRRLRGVAESEVSD